MTKKHFIALADAIRDTNRLEGPGTMRGMFTDEHINTLADFCKSQNGRFNRERWIGYINGTNGPNGGTVTKGKQ